MCEIHYVEIIPRRSDFCGCPPCPLCYEPVLTDDQKAPTFTEVMTEIYADGPAPQTEQEYQWAHAAAHQTRQELDALRNDGAFFAEQDRAHMTQVQIDDLLRQAKKLAEAPKPLNRVNLDDMQPVEASKTPTPAELFEQAETAYQKVYYETQRRTTYEQLKAMNIERQKQVALRGLEALPASKGPG